MQFTNGVPKVKVLILDLNGGPLSLLAEGETATLHWTDVKRLEFRVLETGIFTLAAKDDFVGTEDLVVGEASQFTNASALWLDLDGNEWVHGGTTRDFARSQVKRLEWRLLDQGFSLSQHPEGVGSGNIADAHVVGGDRDDPDSGGDRDDPDSGADD